MAKSGGIKGIDVSGGIKTEVPQWDHAKLDALEKEMEGHIREAFKSKNEDEVACGEVIGYWMYQLKACRVKVTA